MHQYTFSGTSLYDLICNAAEGSDEQVTVRKAYSGRGMYGSTCVGIVCSNATVAQQVISSIIADMFSEMHSATIDAESEEEMRESYSMLNEATTCSSALLEYSWDSMGRAVIIYWPHIVAEDDEQDQEDN